MPIELPPSSPRPAGSGPTDIARAEQVSEALAAYVAAIKLEEHNESAREAARNALSHYVRSFKRDHLGPAQALVRVKVVIRPLVARLRVGEREAFTAEIVRWFIDAYYGARPANGGPRTLEV